MTTKQNSIVCWSSCGIISSSRAAASWTLSNTCDHLLESSNFFSFFSFFPLWYSWLTELWFSLISPKDFEIIFQRVRKSTYVTWAIRSVFCTRVNIQQANGSQKQDSLHTNTAATCIYHLKCKSLSLYLVQKSFYSPAPSLVTLPLFLFVPPLFLSLTVMLYEIDWSLSLKVAQLLSDSPLIPHSSILLNIPYKQIFHTNWNVHSVFFYHDRMKGNLLITFCRLCFKCAPNKYTISLLYFYKL